MAWNGSKSVKLFQINSKRCQKREKKKKKMGKMQKTYLICLIVTSSIVFSVCDALSVFAVSVINMPLSRFDLFIYYHSTYIKKVNLFV